MILQSICWLLTLIVVSFDIFLFVKHATDIYTSLLIGITGSVYIAFLIYLVWKPLETTVKTNATEDGWMSLPQHDEEDEPRQRPRSTDDAEEIYAL